MADINYTRCLLGLVLAVVVVKVTDAKICSYRSSRWIGSHTTYATCGEHEYCCSRNDYAACCDLAKLTVGAIVGIIIGGMFLFGMAVVCICICVQKSKARQGVVVRPQNQTSLAFVSTSNQAQPGMPPGYPPPYGQQGKMAGAGDPAYPPPNPYGAQGTAPPPNIYGGQQVAPPPYGFQNQ